MNLSPLGLTVRNAAVAVAGAPDARSSSGASSGAACRRPGEAARPARRAVGERRARPRPRLRAARRARRRRRTDAARAHAARRRRPVPGPRRRSFPRPTACSAPPSISSAFAADSRRPAAVAVAGELADRPLSAAPRFRRASPEWEPGEEDYAFVRVARRRRPRDSGRPRACGHHRTRPLPLPGRRRKGAAPRGATGLRAQGHREALRSRCRSPTAIGSPAASPATARSRTRGPTRRPLEAIAGVAVPPRAVWLRALLLERERIANHLGDLGYLGNDGGLRVRPFAVLAAEGGRAAHQLASVRPPAADGRHRARRRRLRPRRPEPAARDAATNARASRAKSHVAATSTTTMPGCRTAFAPAAASRRELARNSA